MSSLSTPTLSIGMGRTFESVCLSVCLSVCPQHNAKTNDLKVLKLDIRNDLGISLKTLIITFSDFVCLSLCVSAC